MSRPRHTSDLSPGRLPAFLSMTLGTARELKNFHWGIHVRSKVRPSSGPGTNRMTSGDGAARLASPRRASLGPYARPVKDRHLREGVARRTAAQQERLFLFSPSLEETKVRVIL